MPDSGNSQIGSENGNGSTPTANPVCDAGAYNHLSIPPGSLGAFPSTKSRGFVSGQPEGQCQTSVRGHDQTTRVAKNQKNIVNGEIVIQSESNRIHITAATRIELEVGESKLVMDSEGNITLSGKVIKILGETSTEISAPNNHVCGVTKMDGGDVFVN
jgi:hypothetical protein